MQYGNKPGFGVIAAKYKGKSTAKALIYKQLWQKPREENEEPLDIKNRVSPFITDGSKKSTVSIDGILWPRFV